MAVSGVAPDVATDVAGVAAGVAASGRGRATPGLSETTAMVELDGSRRSLSPLTSKEMLHLGVEGLGVEGSEQGFRLGSTGSAGAGGAYRWFVLLCTVTTLQPKVTVVS